MMKRKIILVTGGQRSGKSSYAQELALKLAENPVYLATSRVWDDEFRDRVRRHQQDRGPQWTNLEEEKAIVTDIAGTTRDIVEGHIRLSKGLQLNLIDTAGIRDTTDIIEQKGIEKGKAEGIQEGQLNEKLAIAKKLFESGQTKEFISAITGLSLEELNKILK